MTELKHFLNRTIVICAQRSTVFRFFTDSEWFADWWGAGSAIEGKPGGIMRICYPNGVTVSGNVLDIESNSRIVFTYGYDSGKPIPPGASTVTITLQDHPEGTQVHLRHEFEDAAIRDEHEAGWPYQLALFANAAARRQHTGLEAILDDYFAIWNTRDEEVRRQTLSRIATADVSFRDAYGCASRAEELNSHIGMAQRFMPLSLFRDGSPQQCQGVAVCNWVARNKEGAESGSGTNVFDLTPDGRIRRVIGFWKGK